MSKFNRHRKAFAFLKKRLEESPEIVREFENAVNTILFDYNTTVPENRFIVGGAMERFTSALLRAVGLDCHEYSSQEHGADLLLPNKTYLSLKTTFTGGYKQVTLINNFGDGFRVWKEATLFLFTEVGMIYADPDMPGIQDFVTQKGDQLNLKAKALEQVGEGHGGKWKIEMNISRKPKSEATGDSKSASRDIADAILRNENLNILLKALKS